VDNIRATLRQIWDATDDLAFDVGETEIRWEDAVVYSQDTRSESIAWTLYKDGVRSGCCSKRRTCRPMPRTTC